MDEATRRDMRQYTGCIAGALTRREFEDALAAAGLEDVDIRETHRVHEQAGSASLRDPQGLYEDWEHAHWAAQDVDLSRNPADWAALAEDQRRLLYWALSSLM